LALFRHKITLYRFNQGAHTIAGGSNGRRGGGAEPPSPLTLTQGSDASWKVLDFFLENSRTWKVLENHFGPGKSWKLKLKVLESPGKISLKVMHFPSGSNGKQAAIV